MSAPPQLPELVTRAFDASRRGGYVSFTRNETGRLLAMLAATRSGVIAELGTGAGIGTAWLRSGLSDNGASILTAEREPALAKAAAELFADDDRVDVLEADWAALADHGPFDLLLLDTDSIEEVGIDDIADLVRTGGVVVIDDLVPCESWPPLVHGRVDPVRERWLTDERFASVEVMPAADSSVLLATRL